MTYFETDVDSVSAEATTTVNSISDRSSRKAPPRIKRGKKAMDLPSVLFSRSRVNGYRGKGEVRIINLHLTVRELVDHHLTPSNMAPAPDADKSKLKHANGFMCDAMTLTAYPKDGKYHKTGAPLPKENFYRNAESARGAGEAGRQVHAIDIDGVPAGTLAATQARLNASGLWYRIYTSASHTDAVECFRVVFVTDRPVSAAGGCLVRRAFAAQLLDHIKPGKHPTKTNAKGEPAATGIDSASFVISQPMFLPWDGAALYGEESDANGLAADAGALLKQAEGLGLKEAEVAAAPEELELPPGCSEAVIAFVDELKHYGATPAGGAGQFKTPVCEEHASGYSCGTPSPDDLLWLLPVNGKAKVLNVRSKHSSDGEDLSLIGQRLEDADPLAPSHLEQLRHACQIVTGEKGSKLEALAVDVMESIKDKPKKAGRPKKLDIQVLNVEQEEGEAAELPEDTFDRSTLHRQTLAALDLINTLPGLKKLRGNITALTAAGINVPAIDAFFRASFWNPIKGRAFVLTPDNQAGMYEKSDVPRICRFTGAWVDDSALAAFVLDSLPRKTKDRDQMAAELTAQLSEAVAGGVADLLRDIPSQATSQRIEIDMFDAVAHLEVDTTTQTAIYTLPFRPFKTGPVRKELLEIYKSHFPLLDEFLDYLTAARFASDRKNAYLYMQMVTDWGKGFLTSALKRLGLMMDIAGEDLEKLTSGGTCAYTEKDFIYAWAVLVNEVTRFTPSMRKLESEIKLNPKYLLSVSVPVYAKIFTGADMMRGLGTANGGVEAQLANRFSYWSLPGKITELDDFSGIKAAMSECLSNYAARFLNKRVAELQALGREEARRWADKSMADFHSKYRISNAFGSLDDQFAEIYEDFKRWVERRYQSGKDSDLDVVSYSKRVDKKTGEAESWLLLRAPQSAFETFARSRHADFTERQNLINNFAAITGYDRKAVVKVRGVSCKGLAWPVTQGSD